MRNQNTNQKGFTIIELMIATTVFSIVLLLSMSALVFMGRLYYKGVNTAKTQEVTRETVGALTDAVKFSRLKFSAVVGNSNWDGAYCMGSKKYSYKLDTVLVKSPTAPLKQSNQVLIESIDTACGTVGVSADPVVGGAGSPPVRELLSDFMRLNEFSISDPNNDGLVDVRVSVAFGGDGTTSTGPDNEIFTFESVSRVKHDFSSNPVVTINETVVLPVKCRTGIAGGQFCAVSGLSKTVLGVQ